MRRTASPLSLVLFGVGVFLLVLAPLLVRYVEPHAKRTPIDVDQLTVFEGKGAYFDTGKVRTVRGADLTVTRQVRGDVADSSDEHAVWDVSTSVDPDKSLPAADPHDSLQWTTERWVTHRRTNAPVHCCDEEPYFEGEAYLKFPFDVQRRTYRWWDNTLGATVPLRFSGVKQVQGYTGLSFTGSVPATRTGTRQVPGRLVGSKADQVLAEEWYANHGVELVADQRTGRILYARIGPRKTLRRPGSDRDAVVLLESRKIAFTAKTQRQQVALAGHDSGRLKLVGETLPIAAAGLGLLLTALGVVLVVRGRERPAPAGAPEGSRAPAPAA